MVCFIQKQFPEGELVEIVSNGLGTFIWIIVRKNEVLRKARLCINLAINAGQCKMAVWRTIFSICLRRAQATAVPSLRQRIAMVLR